MWITSDGRVQVEGAGIAAAWAYTAPGVVPIGTFTHVATVITHQDKIQIFVNGIPQILTAAGTPSLETTQAPATIGSSDLGHGDYYFHGLVDEVEIFNRALTAGEIATLAGGDGAVCPGPYIAVNPTTRDFGDVLVGESSEVTEFTIANLGIKPLVVTVAAPTGGDEGVFSVVPGGIHACESATPTLGPGVQCTLDASFAPAVAVIKTTVLRVESNDPQQPRVDRRLDGRGVWGLQIAIDPASSGSVAGGGIDCPGTCGITAVSGSVELTPTAAAGYQFANWSGAASGSTTPLSVAMDGHKSITATFTALPTYTVIYNGNTNTGGTAPVDASSPYLSGATVTVLGNTGILVKTGFLFAGWNTASNGSGTSYAPAATFTMGSTNVTLYARWTVDPSPTVQFSMSAATVFEAVTPATINVNLSAAWGETVTVNYATANGTAVAGSDYSAISGTLTFTPGETNKTILVPITNDAIQEPDETFTVTLTTPVNARPGAIPVHTCTIDDKHVPGVGGLKAIAEAVDQEGWTFSTTVGAGWWRQAAVTHDGTDAARSGFITGNQASSFQTTGSFGAGTVSFWWKVSSEAGHDYLRFSIDGAVRDAIAGEVNWQQKSYSITAGVHTLKWEYMKDGTGTGGIDAAWVDQFVPTAPAVLWTRGETGDASLRPLYAGALPGILAAADGTTMSVPTGEGGPWEAISCSHADATTDYVLWTRGDTGQAILAKVNPGADAGSIPDSDWANLKAPVALDGPWQATSYAHVDATEGYVLWSRSDTGQALLEKVVPETVTGTIPVASWAYLKTPAGVGAPWQASSYTHVDATTGYVLWSRSDTGQAILWKVTPGAVSGTIPVTSWAHLDTRAGAGEPWQASSYTHIDASEGYVLWTRGDTGQTVLWQVAPGEVSGTIPVVRWTHVSSPEAVGGPWRATSYVHGASPETPAAAVDEQLKTTESTK